MTREDLIRAVAPPTRPEQPIVIDNDEGEITVELPRGNELRGWSYKTDAERRMKMLAAREYVEGWCDATEKIFSAIDRLDDKGAFRLPPWR